jgi:hypothetical protein
LSLQCPAGSYNALERQWNASACLACPNNTYAYLPGQAACLPCSASAYTNKTGSTTCNCIGLYRSFQMSDGFCTCYPGYEFQDANFTVYVRASEGLR